jgi:nucleoside-diphosphate-sugar epimerase
MADPKLILVTGATGYVGGRLVPRLLAVGYRVRCLVRDPARLQGRVWLKQVELACGDMLQPESLVPAIRENVQTHSFIFACQTSAVAGQCVQAA